MPRILNHETSTNKWTNERLRKWGSVRLVTPLSDPDNKQSVWRQRQQCLITASGPMTTRERAATEEVQDGTAWWLKGQIGGGHSILIHPTHTSRRHKVLGWEMITVSHFLTEILGNLGYSAYSLLPGSALRCSIKLEPKITSSFSPIKSTQEDGKPCVGRLAWFLILYYFFFIEV